MSDLLWFIIISILLLMLGILFIRLGYEISEKQRIDLIIAYHHDKVSENNKQAYCVLSGIGVLIIGCGLLLSGICTLTVRSAYVFIPMATGLILGIALLISAGMRYNR
jgi:hypothetical protein